MPINNKTIMQRIWLGVKKAWSLTSLPVSVSVFNNYPLVRVFRVLGGISILLVLGKYELPQTLFYVIFPLALIQFIYIIVINIINIYIFNLFMKE